MTRPHECEPDYGISSGRYEGAGGYRVYREDCIDALRCEVVRLEVIIHIMECQATPTATPTATTDAPADKEKS